MHIHYTLTLDDYREGRGAIGLSARWLSNGLVAFAGLFILTVALQQRLQTSKPPSPPATREDSLALLIPLSVLAAGVFALGFFARRQVRLCRDITSKTAWGLRGIGIGTSLVALGLWLTQPQAAEPAADVWWCVPLWFFLLAWAARRARGNDAVLWKAMVDQHRPKQMELRPDGVVISDGVSRHEYQWIGFLRGNETPHLFLLMPNRFGMFMIPKRAFASEQDRATFAKAMTDGIRPPTGAFPLANTPLPPPLSELPEAQLYSPSEKQAGPSPSRCAFHGPPPILPLMFDSFATLVREARSRRRYIHVHPVSRETVVGLVDLARLGPSAMNAQPLRYRIVTEPGECEEVFKCTNWAKGLRTGPAPTPDERPPAWVLMLSVQPAGFEPGVDVGIAAQTINLGANAAGLATCMLASIDRAHLAEVLKVPSGLKIELLISIGKAGETVAIEQLGPGVPTPYWRTPDQVHHVPKRRLEDVLL